MLDYALELSWWIALAYHFASRGDVRNAFTLVALLIGADLIEQLARRSVKNRVDRNLDDVAPIDRVVRLIGGRRNIYVWMFAVGLLLHAADKAFVALCYWSALTAAVHVCRAAWIHWQCHAARAEGASH